LKTGNEPKGMKQVGSRVRERYQEIPPNKIVTVSNIISIFRGALAMPIVYCMHHGLNKWALAFIIIAIVSDMLDGWLARISNEITELGKVLDPLSDKVVIFSVMLYLATKDAIPMGYFAVLLFRDFTISLLGIYMLNNCRVSPQANKLGKVSIIFTIAIEFIIFLEK